MVIGIGGGSVMDASKVIAFGYYDPDGMWQRIASWEDGYEKPDQALPIILVSTLAATGSEGDAGAVVTNTETNTSSITNFFMPSSLFQQMNVID